MNAIFVSKLLVLLCHFLTVQSYRLQDIIQSSSGHMWLVKSGGLSSFDGDNFKSYYSHLLSPTILNSFLCVVEVDNNELLNGTENRVLIFNPEKE